MSDTRTDAWNTFIWPLLAVVAVSIVPYPLLGLPELHPLAERWMVWIGTAAATIAHIHYGQGVVSGRDNFVCVCLRPHSASTYFRFFAGPRDVRPLSDPVFPRKSHQSANILSDHHLDQQPHEQPSQA